MILTEATKSHNALRSRFSCDKQRANLRLSVFRASPVGRTGISGLLTTQGMMPFRRHHMSRRARLGSQESLFWQRIPTATSIINAILPIISTGPKPTPPCSQRLRRRGRLRKLYEPRARLPVRPGGLCKRRLDGTLSVSY